MKRFGFSLDEELHAALQARAESEGTSMAAVCRTALFLHLQASDYEYAFPPDATSVPDQSKSTEATSQVFQELDDFLDEWTPEFSRELDIPELLWDEPALAGPFHPDQVPDLFFKTIAPPDPKCYTLPVKFGPGGLVLRGFHHPGIERCERPFNRVVRTYDPDIFQWD